MRSIQRALAPVVPLLALLCAFAGTGLAAVRGDFNGDGKADVVWRNASTGENYLYPMNGALILPGEGYLRGVADANWKIVGIGDFDGDGKADLLWRNSSTGQNYIYFMDGTSIKPTEGFIRTVADLNWSVAGIGDFDGDGKDDILWRNSSTGESYLYPMNGLAIQATEGFVRTVADPNWQVAGVGDFDGDGKADVLWRNLATGENYLYPMNGTAILAGEGYVRSVADTNWKVAGVGDFDGDGKADVLWRNSSTGENYLYPMNGLAIKAGEGYLRTVADLDWTVAAVGDFDGDGKADILWRKGVTGENYVYPMNGTAIKPAEGYLRTVADANWRVALSKGARRADVIIAVDTSGSMTQETNLVRLQLNTFAAMIRSSGVDLNVVLIADPAKLCVPAPLGSGACPADGNLPGYRHVATAVQSTDALQVILNTYAQWSASLRAGSLKTFLVVSDDDSNLASSTFNTQLLALNAGLAGYRFDAIVATVAPVFFPTPNACANLGAALGTQYINLAGQTGGIARNLCDQSSTDFTTHFDAFAAAIIAGAQ